MSLTSSPASKSVRHWALFALALNATAAAFTVHAGNPSYMLTPSRCGNGVRVTCLNVMRWCLRFRSAAWPLHLSERDAVVLDVHDPQSGFYTCLNVTRWRFMFMADCQASRACLCATSCCQLPVGPPHLPDII